MIASLRSLNQKTISALSAQSSAISPDKSSESAIYSWIKVYGSCEAAIALAKSAEETGASPHSLMMRLAQIQLARAGSELFKVLLSDPSQFGLTRDEITKHLVLFELKHSVLGPIGRELVESGNVPEFPIESEESNMIRSSFRKFADTHVVPIAESIHRNDELIPESLISALRELGCFGLTIPEAYGGFELGENTGPLGMVLVTEELSRGSLGAAGSLVTRPEILARALLKGGTEEQKKKWLPQIAAGEKMAAIAVTEPDYGSDVAQIRVTAKRDSAQKGWRISGTKTWCTFAGRADVLAVLARTDSDLSLKHKGLSLFLIEKPQVLGHSFKFSENGGVMDARAIATIGYRGMHSFEVTFENWFVPENALVGGDAYLGKGFYLQMEGFTAGRLQTAARANGLMHAALEKAIHYVASRQIFGVPLYHHEAMSAKITQMAASLLACRALTYQAARVMDTPEGSATAALAKLYCSATAEWLTREAQQTHGGMGYAEEYAVSRYFVDARVLSIFEGAEEVLALKVIAPQLFSKKN